MQKAAVAGSNNHHHRGPGEIKRREVELDPQVSPEEIMSREVESGCQKLDFFRFGLFLNSGATDIVLVTLPSTAVETAVARCTSCCAMARGHRLNTSVVLAAVHGLSGLFRTVSAVQPSLSRPLPPLSPSLISNLASVDVKQHGPVAGSIPKPGRVRDRFSLSKLTPVHIHRCWSPLCVRSTHQDCCRH